MTAVNKRGQGMAVNEPTFTIGIEEEYLLVDKETRRLVVDPPKVKAEDEILSGAGVLGNAVARVERLLFEARDGLKARDLEISNGYGELKGKTSS